MKYKVLPNARVLTCADNSKQLFIDTGSEVIPVNNRLAYTDKQYFTFDGDYSKILDLDGLPLVKVSDDAIDLSTVSQVKVWNSRDGFVSVSTDALYVEVEPMLGNIAFLILNDNDAIIFSAPSTVQVEENFAFPKGTYAICAPDNFYVASIAYEYTKKIDDKYLPPMPVTINVGESLNGGATGEGTKVYIELSEKTSKQIIDAYKSGAPVIYLESATSGAKMVQIAIRADWTALNGFKGYMILNTLKMFKIQSDTLVTFEYD